MPELNELSASEAARLIASKTITSEALTRACLGRIAERNPSIGAFAHVDEAFSIAEAQRADRETPRSPLHGIPFAVKDVIDTRDLPTERGTPLHRGRQPAADARCVELKREAGAVLLGKLVTTEYAMFTPNETRHPLNTDYTPGGSSSGTGAAVADCMGIKGVRALKGSVPLLVAQWSRMFCKSVLQRVLTPFRCYYWPRG